jgi:hypothetical protein
MQELKDPAQSPQCRPPDHRVLVVQALLQQEHKCLIGKWQQVAAIRAFYNAAKRSQRCLTGAPVFSGRALGNIRLNIQLDRVENLVLHSLGNVHQAHSCCHAFVPAHR